MTTSDLPQGPGVPTAPIEIAGGAASAGSHLIDAAPLDEAVLARLHDVCADISVEAGALAEASRDWWPLAMIWATEGKVGARAAALVRPADTAEVCAVLAICNEAGVPVTAAGGRSGVSGASVPTAGGVILDTTALAGIASVDDESLTVDVGPGTFGDAMEIELRDTYGLTIGHWPQSVTLSTVGGWVACRGAGQYSTRYGNIEDMVVGLDVALADGSLIHTGGMPKSAAGPDLTQLFVGSEGTLGIICGVRLRAHPLAPFEARSAYSFKSFDDGMDACRRIMRRGATPAVLRLYDDIESNRSHGTPAPGEEGAVSVLLVLDEGDRLLVEATMRIVAEECLSGDDDGNGPAKLADVAMVEGWMGHRNDVSALESLIGAGFVVDTMEIAAPWSRLDEIYSSTLAAIGGIDGVKAVSAHQSHSYRDGACLYFTFAGKVEPELRERFYTDVWDAGTRSVLAGGGNLSHHHGVGLNRARFMPEALGESFDTLVAVKAALDPNGILNPHKLGLNGAFGDAAPWPTGGSA